MITLNGRRSKLVRALIVVTFIGLILVNTTANASTVAAATFVSFSQPNLMADQTTTAAQVLDSNLKGRLVSAKDYPSALMPKVSFGNTFYAYLTGDDSGTASAVVCSKFTASGKGATNTCSLRSALNNANNTPHSTDNPNLVIVKTYGNGGSYSVTNGQLPTLAHDIYLTDDPSFSCPGGLNNTAVLDFKHSPANTTGLAMSNGNFVSGIEVENAPANGIQITGGSNKLTCTLTAGNFGNGILLSSGASNNNIGGLAGNVGTIGNVEFASIYNGGYGVAITGAGTTNNTVVNSGIGYLPGVSDSTGDNMAGGILISSGASNNVIGSNQSNQTNLIGFNSQNGITITGTGTTGNKIWGNFIGSDETGSQPRSNQKSGVLIANGASTNLIGGDRTQGFGNLISGNNFSNTNGTNYGVEIMAASSNLVEGNNIGANLNFSNSLSNTGSGVYLHGGSQNNQIGGEEDANTHLGNITSGNTGSGIVLSDSNTNNNLVMGNYVGTNNSGSSFIFNNASGIVIHDGASHNTIGGTTFAGQGNLISGNGNGISLYGTGTNYNNIYGNFIGTDKSGSAKLGNSYDGIVFTGAANYNQVGGELPGQGNVISGNNNNGIELTEDASTGNTIQSNHIGTNLAGTAAIPNFLDGISIRSGTNITVGGSILGQGNLISGNNAGYGIRVLGVAELNDSIDNLVIQGNFIGTDVTGSAAIPNGYGGISISVSKNDQIGGDRGFGPGIGAGNLISGNHGVGIGMGATNSKVQGNIIGLSLKTTQALPNGDGIDMGSSLLIGGEEDNNAHLGNIIAGNSRIGLYFNHSSQNEIYGNRIGTDLTNSLNFGNSTSALAFGGNSSNNVIGKETPGYGNIIAFNDAGDDFSAAAVTVGSDSAQNTFSGNSIYNNTGLGISLNFTYGGTGVFGGSDSGANNQAQAPAISSASVGNTLSISGTANPNSIVEVFAGDNTVPDNSGNFPQSTQGRTFLGATNADNSGAFSLSQSALPTGVVLTATNTTLVATSTLNDPAFPQRKGSTSQFSAPFTPTLLPALSLSGVPTSSSGTNSLSFSTSPSSTTPITQTIALNAYNGNINWTSSIAYSVQAGSDNSIANWLTVTPASSGSQPIISGTAQSLLLTLNASNIHTDGIYNAVVTFSDVNGGGDQVKLNVTLTVANYNYSYYLPFLANSTLNGYTTYLVFQNTSSSVASNAAPAIINTQYYDTGGNGLTSFSSSIANQCQSIAPHGECVAANPFALGASGSGIIESDQPLAVVVAEATPFGGSAYAVGEGASNSLVAPLALRNAYGDFNTQLTLFNPGGSALSATINFYDQNGVLQSGATQNLTIPAYSTQVLDQAAASSNLPASFNGWAQISSPNGTKILAQVVEQSASQKFVAIVNAQTTPQNKLYAPAIFKGAFGFNTGTNIINPNASPVNVTVTYYDDSGNAFTAAPFSLAAHAIQPIYQGSSSGGGNGLPGSSSGLPANFSGAAIVTSDGGGVIMAVNESGGISANGTSLSGVYAAASSGSGSVGLPVMANGGYGYTTGATIFNTSGQAVSGSIQYYDISGSPIGTAQSFTIAPYASQLAYQGVSGLLPSGFYGTAVVTQNNTTNSSSGNLIVTTNALSGLFYTYTEPNQ